MRPVLRWAALGAGIAAVALGCGRRGPNGDAQGGDAGDAGDDEEASSPPADAGTGDAGLVGDGATVSNCAPEASLIYLVSEELTLYSFDPTKNVVTPLGSVDCAGGIYANSMAVDRSGTAWINYGDDSLWKVSVKNPQCEATGFIPNQQGVGLFGMGFASKSPGSNDEQLFICDLSGGGLGYIDLTNMTLLRLGPFTGDLAGRAADLSGTGDARLFGFFAGSPLGDAGSAEIAQIDPNTEGPVAEYPLPTIDTGSDWAFSFYGGDFYLYTADKYNANAPDSTIWKYSPGDGGLSVVQSQLTFRIVGAGSSTCVPTTPAQ